MSTTIYPVVERLSDLAKQTRKRAEESSDVIEEATALYREATEYAIASECVDAVIAYGNDRTPFDRQGTNAILINLATILKRLCI